MTMSALREVLLANPFQNFQSHLVRELQVQQHHGRDGITVNDRAYFSLACQITDCFLTIIGDLDGVLYVYALESCISAR